VTGFPFDQTHARLARLSAGAYAEEAQALMKLLPEARWFDTRAESIAARAERWVLAVRAAGARTGLEAFQREYGLSSREGIMIMCLAEALLRIPDAATADALIHDKLGQGEWDRHTGLGRSWLMRAGALGFEIAGAISDEDSLKVSAGEFIGGLVHRLGEPIVRGALKAAMKTMGGAFVIGSTFEKAQLHARENRREGLLYSFDMLGEGARSMAQAEVYFARYLHAVEGIYAGSGELYLRDGVSIKLSALHPRFELRNWQALKSELLPKLRRLLATAAKKGVPLTVDAEETTRLDVTLLCFEALLKSPECKGFDGLGLAVQAYQKRAAHVIDWLAELAQETGRRISVRLVKGAYWDGEIKRAQENGLSDYPVFTRKAHTDVSYLACAKKLLLAPQVFYPQFATHNARTIAGICEMAGETSFEFQRLWGMGEALYEQVMRESAAPCRIYAPVGEPRYLLSYLIRRILENGANNSFVRGLFDAPLDELLADPVALVGTAFIPIPLPEHILPNRRNSRGIDLGNLNQLERIWPKEDAPQPPVKDATPADCAPAFARAQKAFSGWRDLPVSVRAERLESLAALFAAREHALLCLLMREGKKTLADSVSEVREAIDYCRYYAQGSRELLAPLTLPGVSGEHNTLALEARGVFVALSPWNFPLAIFTGQIVAALVTGNCVIAKPAEQTPEITAFAVSLMHEAGIPKDVLQLLPGSGEVVGHALVSHPACAGVVFTGGTQTAWAINQALASRNAAIAPLIAETGGQNCMVVDSSALIEQAVDDIIVSAFGSAGQRCSALRVLFVQEDIADELLEVLAGAMAALRVGPVNDVAVDIGPVIDREAYDKLVRHIAGMQKSAKLIAATPLPEGAAPALLVSPHAFLISSIHVLEGEIFGPVLHVVRWRMDDLGEVIAQINSTGYGLTFGIHSRIDARIRELSARVQAGNIYVNRSMIGASVGMQPFGGHGLSGTGPKAGGPHYLARFCRERTVCVNTAAVGGNLELLV
jgi:RHH-type proline utilization regulon transcriptional repressor/proline dehydrogenase/delta 1-pyrroline-5-carboxylate dehydrogenase